MGGRFLTLLAVLGLLSGCKVYDPDLVQSGPGCDLNKPPPRPAAPDDGMDIGEVAYALRDIVFDQGERWREIGYDLDDKCSTRPNFDVECVPIGDNAPEVDGRNGTDNVFGHWLYPIVELGVGDLEMASRQLQAVGNGAILLRVFEWNGEPDDSRVRVEAAVTVFGTPGNADGSKPDIDLSGPDPVDRATGLYPAPPNWDGFDYFWARSDNFVSSDPGQPRIRDDNAYVANNTLVISPPDRTEFIFPGDDIGIVVKLTDIVVTAEISEDYTRLERVIVAGRWSRDDLLLTANAVGVCDGSSVSTDLMEQLDNFVDVRSRRGTGGPEVACDAISLGIELVGYPASFGDLAIGPELASPCDDPMTDAGTAPDAGM